jgi:hypothetical protein
LQPAKLPILSKNALTAKTGPQVETRAQIVLSLPGLPR